MAFHWWMKCNAVDMGIKIRHVLAREEEYIHISLYLSSVLDLIQIMRRNKYIYALEHCDTMIVAEFRVSTVGEERRSTRQKA